MVADVLAVIGGLLIVAGVALLSIPVALITGGALSIALAWRLS